MADAMSYQKYSIYCSAEHKLALAAYFIEWPYGVTYMSVTVDGFRLINDSKTHFRIANPLARLKLTSVADFAK